jgi:hypothetical protein
VKAKALSILLTLLLVATARAQEGGVTLRYGTADHKDEIASETSLSITVEGTDAAVGFVRSMHPLMSLNTFHVRARVTHRLEGEKHTVEPEDARVELRYDDEPSEYDWKRSEPPEDLATNKLEQMVWFLSIAPRSYELSAAGAYKSGDPNQDHNGEAMDLLLNGVTRMPDGAVKAGATYTREWQGERQEKSRKGRFAFKQIVTIVSIEDRGGKKVATLTSKLTGELGGPKDPNAEEAFTRCQGTTRTTVEVESGRVLAAEGSGKVTAYFKNTAADGTKNEVTIVFQVEGKRAVRH